MKTNEIMANVKRTFSKTGLKIKKHSPEILLVAGVAGTVVSAVMACKATTKISTILDDAKDTVEAIHDTMEDPNFADKYTKEDGKKDLTIVYTQTGLQLAKLYAPSVLLGVASIGCILASNNIIRKRNVALAAAYTAVDSSFKDYRKRVIDRFGKELDRELRYNIKAKEVEEVVVNEDGTEATVKKTVSVGNPKDFSPYTICFDETCTGWVRDAEANLFFLKQVEQWANQKLQEQGHLFLNELYDMIGAQRTRAGQQVGWVYDPENPDIDGFVDLGIFDIYDENKRAFVNGYEKSIWIDPNVDGVIYDLLK